MTITRRDFLAGAAAACACGLTAGGCKAINPAATYVASADQTIGIPKELTATGSQVKVMLPGTESPILVWKTADGYMATTITCTHRGSEVGYNAKENTLDCPSHGSRYHVNGSVLHGPAQDPLKAYKVEAIGGNRLKITPA